MTKKNTGTDASPGKKPSTAGEEAQRPKDEHGFPVVAIGASAGGLRALQELFSHLSADTGMAFVVIVHLSSEHESNLPQLLARHTDMPVRSVGEVQKLAPDQVFIIPPDRTLTLKDGNLQLSEREKSPGKFKPIDRFFESLAEQMGERAIGVILSGTGSDGSSGIKAIKTGGGTTFAQAEGSAQFAEMPRNAVLSGYVDFELAPKDIAGQLGEPIRHPVYPPPEEDASSDWAEIHRLLKTRGGDFSHYKQGTLRRRLARRMSIHKITELSEYAAFLKDHPREVAALREDLLIKVTEFFRDAGMFEALEEMVFPKILEGKRDDESIRVWVPGCASGEEVYSLAMALTEFQGKSGSHIQVQIFGTDVSEGAIDKARQGFYEKGQLSGVSQDRLGKFFLPVTGGFKVRKHLREMCVFARQDFISDPPFSRLDLISCRNVLIYFDPSLQKKVFPLFHYALNPGGFLVLGSAENVSQAGNLFSSIDEKNRVFARKKAAQREVFASWGYRQARQPSSHQKVQPFEHRQRKGDEHRLHREVDRHLLRRLDPAAVVVDSELNVVEFRGNTAPFIEHQPGKATLDLLKITRDTLRLDLQALLRDAQEKDEPQTREHLYREAGQERSLTLEASPLHFDQEHFFLIRFIPPPASRPDSTRPDPTQTPEKIRDEALRQENQRLKRELATSLELIQQMREEKNSALEDLNASNEEVLSSNEELQSINEELETSKEELESSVEELNTVNQELQHRNEELKQAHSDLYTLIQSVQIPFLILNEDLKIRRISPDAKKTLNVSPGDVGRSVTELSLSFEVRGLEKILTRVIRSGRGEEVETLGRNRRWYLLRIDPIDEEESAKGAVLALFDIDRLKRSLEETEKAYKYSLRIVDTIKDPLLVLDEELRIKKANPAFYQKFQVKPKETEGREVFSLGSGQWDRPELRSLLSEILPQSMQMDNFQVDFDFPHLGPRTMLLSARRMKATFSPREAILLGITDVTDQKKIEDYLRRAKQSAEETSRAKSEFLANLSHEIRTPMTVIIGALAFLEEASLDSDQKRFVEMAAKSAQNLLDLLDDLLDFSKIEVDKIKIHSEPFDLRQNVEDAVDILKLEAERKGLEFSWQIAEEVPSAVLGDRKRLRQVLVNLVGNALKFTEMGRIDIAVEVSREAPPKGTPALLFSIQDTGIGISAEDVSRLFQNFTQLDSSSTRRYGGSGLGLAICRGLVERMGGQIWLESLPGEGSTFFFTLPLQESDDLAGKTGDEEPQASSGSSPIDAVTTGTKILLGEDNPAIRDLVALTLKMWGWDLVCAENGREAVDKHRAESPDIILMDLQMPVMDGLQATREIRQRESGQGRRVPIIGLTAHARRQERDQCLEAGMDDILTKPIDTEKLQTLIRKYLE